MGPGTKGQKAQRDTCLMCHMSVALRKDGRFRSHRGIEAEGGGYCSGSGEMSLYGATSEGWDEAIDGLGIARRPPVLITKEQRIALSEEIRSMIPPPWTRNEMATLKAKMWRDVADFVERSGDWKGFEI